MSKLTLRRSDIRVRKTLPTHLVAQRVMQSKKLYSRKGEHFDSRTE